MPGLFVHGGAGVQRFAATGAGDQHEEHADQVADAVVAGRSAERLLDAYSGGGGRDRRDPGGRGRDRRGLGGDFDSDWAGRAILDRYLDGGGDWDIVDDPSWTEYMKASRILRGELRAQILALAEGYKSIQADAVIPVQQSFHAEVENGEGVIGYQYLHGTNKLVGDFKIFGNARIHREHGSTQLPASLPAGECEAPVASEASPDQLDQICSEEPPAPALPPVVTPPDAVEVPPSLTVELEVSFQWNDKIDPNQKYVTDKIKDAIAWAISLGGRSSYRISIAWKEKVKLVFDAKGKLTEKTGYPVDL